jgi:hypothetical protein
MERAMRPEEVAARLAEILGTQLYQCDQAIRTADTHRALTELADAVVKIELIVRILRSISRAAQPSAGGPPAKG